MRLLREIYRKEGLTLSGRTITREAVRGIIRSGGQLLMVYSTKNREYKFPGGGVDINESHAQTLAREVREECGAQVTQIEGPFGKVIEYDRPQEVDFDLFRMTSYYYLCQVEPGLVSPCLEAYERELGYQAVWVTAAEAIRTNRTVLQSVDPPRWTARDTLVLQLVQAQVLSKTGGC